MKKVEINGMNYMMGDDEIIPAEVLNEKEFNHLYALFEQLTMITVKVTTARGQVEYWPNRIVVGLVETKTGKHMFTLPEVIAEI